MASIKQHRDKSKHQSTILLTINKNDLLKGIVKIVDEGKEIAVDNKLYDIVCINYENKNEISLTVNYDAKETFLAKNQKDNLKKVFKQSLNAKYIASQKIFLSIPVTNLVKKTTGIIHSHYNSCLIDKLSPPPRA